MHACMLLSSTALAATLGFVGREIEQKPCMHFLKTQRAFASERTILLVQAYVGPRNEKQKDDAIDPVCQKRESTARARAVPRSC
jgi:hypothetical protein